MTGIQAARAAASLRREMGVDVSNESGHYGEFRVFVDGEEVLSGGPLAFMGVLPSVSAVQAAVARKLDTKD